IAALVVLPVLLQAMQGRPAVATSPVHGAPEPPLAAAGHEIDRTRWADRRRRRPIGRRLTPPREPDRRAGPCPASSRTRRPRRTEARRDPPREGGCARPPRAARRGRAADRPARACSSRSEPWE